MNTKISAAIKSMRLRTLPLSLAGVVLGTMLAACEYKINTWAVFFVLLTTVLLQILSNMSNELGDVLKGTDTEERQGPNYGIGEDGLTVREMKSMVSVIATLCAISGIAMIWISFGTLFCTKSILLLALGASAIAGAMHYTLGKNPYGYRGLGDLFVFIFFGLVSVLGAYFVVAHTIHDWRLVLPATAIGCFSIGVLNVNNIRDMKTDAANRVTVAIKLGLDGARFYQTVLICLGWIMMLLFAAIYKPNPWHFLFILVIPFYIKHLKGVWTRTERALDPMLPLLVIATFLLSLIAGISFILF